MGQAGSVRSRTSGKTLAGCLIGTAFLLTTTVVLARRHLVLIRIVGLSMRPTFHPGDRVLVSRRGGEKIRSGSVIVLSAGKIEQWLAAQPHPATLGMIGFEGTDWIIKRVAAAPGDPVPMTVLPMTGGVMVVPPGKLVVLGDSMRSLDSRAFGFVDAELVLGVVLLRLPSRDYRPAAFDTFGQWP